MEHGFRLDATHHHIHFVDRGKISFYVNRTRIKSEILVYSIQVLNLFPFLNLSGEFFDVREFAPLYIRLDLNCSLTMVVAVCQYIHKVSAASQENPQQMVLASKLFGQERSCEEYLARAKDQLMSIGTGTKVDDSFESFNMMRAAKFNHAVREKGAEEKLTAAASTSPRVVVARPHPSINSKLAGPKVCQKQE